MSKQATTTVRTSIKNELGYSSRKVSVRASSSGSIVVTVKDPESDFAAIEEIAKRVEKIDRDGFGEILSGGNTFVFVQWSTEARQERASRYIGSVSHAIEALKLRGEKSTSLEQVAENVLIGWDQPGYGFRLWRVDARTGVGQAGMHVNTPECAAAVVADYVDGF